MEDHLIPNRFGHYLATAGDVRNGHLRERTRAWHRDLGRVNPGPGVRRSGSPHPARPGLYLMRANPVANPAR